MSSVLPALLTLLVLLLVFLVCRELVCWYWKVNEGLVLLKRIADRLDPPKPPAPPPIPNANRFL